MNASRLIGRTVHASDGDVGEISSLYFDGQQWKVRYAAVAAFDKQLLIPVAFITRQDFSRDRIDVNLTRDQVRNSPDVDLNLAVSQAAEEEIARHFNLPAFWEAEVRRTPQGEETVYIPPGEKRMISAEERTVVFSDEQSGTTVIAERIPDARYLFGSEDIRKYRVFASDGKVGNVEDFIISDTGWKIRYLVTDASSLVSGKKVLLSPLWVDSINEPEGQVRLDLTTEAVKDSPSYDPARPIDPEMERNLFERYSREYRASPYALWRFNYKRQEMESGKKLRIVLQAPAVVHWTTDNWKSSYDTKTHDTGMGVHIAELDTENVSPGKSLHFTFFWPQANHWEGQNFSVRVKQMVRERERVPAGV
ncbi:MAG: PRC-barrel domain-containing protein [Endomicrobiales bacterium]